MKRIIFIAFLILGILPISQAQCRLDAATQGDDGAIYFFQGDSYYRYSERNKTSAERYLIQDKNKWGALPYTNFDAVTRLYQNNKYYFYKEKQVVRYDFKLRKKDNGYPKDIGIMGDGIPPQPDAIANIDNETLYFFKDKEVHIYSRKQRKIKEVKALHDVFEGLPNQAPDAAFFSYYSSKKLFLIYGNQIYRFTNNKLDDGFPKRIDLVFSGLVPKGCEGIGFLDPNPTNTGTLTIGEQPQLTPIHALPQTYPFHQDKPKVAILIHGITPDPKTENGKKQKVGRHQHPQFYWGFDFIRLLLGSPIDQTPEALVQTNNGLRPFGFSQVKWADHRKSIIPQHINTSAALLISNGRDRKLDVMVTYRDGSDYAQEQLIQTIDQIYDSYQSQYGQLAAEKQPQIYLIAHSFGGILSRIILSEEAYKQFPKLDEEKIKKARFIRDRTVSLTTLSTPHQASPLINDSKKKSEDLLKLAHRVEQMDGQITLDNFDIKIPTGGLNQSLASMIRSFEQEWIEGSRKCIQSMSAMDDLNEWLQPQFALRSDGQLIPIYTLSGSNPGHVFFLSPRPAVRAQQFSLLGIPLGRLDLNSNNFTDLLGVKDMGYDKTCKESALLAFLELGSKNLLDFPKGSWEQVYPGFKDGDKFTNPLYSKEFFSTSKFNFINEWPLYGALTYPGIDFPYQSDGYFDSDGFVGFESGHGLKLGTDEIAYFANYKTYTLDGKNKNGSWYRILGDRYGQSFPWDYDNHRSICFNPGNAAFIKNYILQQGHLISNGKWSTWNNTSSETSLSTKKLVVKITTIKNLSPDGDIDGGLFENDRKADFYPYVKIGAEPLRLGGNSVINKNYIASKDFKAGKDYIWKVESSDIRNGTLIPVLIRIMDYDEDGQGKNDVCGAGRLPYQNDIIVYVDIQNERLYGDAEGELGITHEVFGHPNNANRVRTKFKIEIK